MRTSRLLLAALLPLLVLAFAFAAGKPKLTLDEFFNSVGFTDVEISPDGHSVVIATERADWESSKFRKDIWLYRNDNANDNANGGALTQLTQSGRDNQPQWSPDGHRIAFLTERKTSKSSDDDKDKDKDDETAQLYLIARDGGEACPETQGEEEVHACSWTADTRTLYFATRIPWTKAQKDAYKKEWKDVNQYRAAERGDMIFSMGVAD